MKEYKQSKTYVIFLFLVIPLAIIIFTWLFIKGYANKTENEVSFWILGPILVLIIVAMFIGLIDSLKARFVIDHDNVFSEDFFSKRQLMLHEIKGYRILDKLIIIESNDENKNEITINKHYSNTDEIMEWLSKNFQDLDIIQNNDELDIILNNDSYGMTIEQREEKLNLAKKISRFLNWTGIIIGIWTFFWPTLYEYMIIISIGYPLLCLFVIKYFKGLIKFDGKNNSANPSLFYAIISSIAGMCLRALYEFKIFDYTKLWEPTILITLTYVLVLIYRSNEFEFKKAIHFFELLITTVIIFCYSIGAVITINCYYDRSNHEHFKAVVLDKETSSGRIKTYNVKLSAWGPQNEVDFVSISKNLFNNLYPNDTVQIYLKRGHFEIPWFKIAK